MRLPAAVVCLALGGCDNLFQLDGLRPSIDASTIDAIGVDTYTGPTPNGCWSGAYMGDEDQDTVVDGCDNCPLMDNQLQEDRDADGVGDICDANPDARLEKIAYFHPMVKFYESEWVVSGQNGNWQDNSNGIQQTNNGTSNTVRTLARVKTPTLETFNQPMVQVIVLSTTPDPDPGLTDDSRSALGVYVITQVEESTIGTPGGIRCGLEFPLASSPSGARAFVEKEFTNMKGTATVIGAAPPALITVSTRFPDQEPTDPITPTCTVRNAPGAAGVATPTFGASLTPDNVRIGVWTMNASATFIAMFVTDRL